MLCRLFKIDDHVHKSAMLLTITKYLLKMLDDASCGKLRPAALC